MNRERFEELLGKWLNQQLSQTELEEFLDAAREEEYAGLVAQAYTQDAVSGKFNGTVTDAHRAAAYDKFIQAIHHTPPVPVHRVHFLKTAWFKYAAAILILITAVAVYYNFSHTSQPDNKVVQNVPPASGNDVQPGYNRAVLTLSDGSKVELDSAASETIIDGALSIKNNNGQLFYQASGTAEAALRASEAGAAQRPKGVPRATNTMTTPRGGQYQLTLSDGTKVWLNAASSITYPIAFTQNTREVSITGEAYFEVAKNKEKPFIVKTPGEEITVLGTAFNVNVYENEQSKTSLVEGSISLRHFAPSRSSAPLREIILKPGQAYNNGAIINTDVQQDIAWKSGFFNFNHVKLPEAMRQVARWYDVEVIYKSGVPDIEFVGKMGRQLTLQQMLESLEIMGVNFKLEGRTLIVTK